jgi:hypothetical protein
VADSEDFSLVLGGPLYQLLLRTRLARPRLELVRRRVLVITLVAWLPLLALSAFEGRAFGGVDIPFLRDLDAQVRLLVALPLLILAERIVHERLLLAVQLFVEKGIVRPQDRPRFAAIVTSTMRWRNSLVVELGLLAFLLIAGHRVWAEAFAIHGETWFVRATDSGPGMSYAGLWYGWISLPIVQFILLRWWYRLILWSRFLFRVSRLDLDLSAANPDRAGGLGFLGTSTAAFGPLLLAQSALVSAMVGSRILQEGAQLQDFKLELGGALAFFLFQALGPLMVFAPNLVEAKRRGLREYGLFLLDRTQVISDQLNLAVDLSSITEELALVVPERLTPHRHGRLAVGADGVASVDDLGDRVVGKFPTVLLRQKRQVGRLWRHKPGYHPITLAIRPMASTAILEIESLPEVLQHWTLLCQCHICRDPKHPERYCHTDYPLHLLDAPHESPPPDVRSKIGKLGTNALYLTSR